MSFEAFKAQRHFGSLDGLRALSIIGVVWFHAARGQPLFFAAQGSNGVPLFFAISGFLITTLLLREHDRRKSISLRDFYMRRALRIFPLYYAVLAVYTVLVLLKERHTEPGSEFLHNLRYFATYTSNWFVPLQGRVIFYFAWSLAAEEQFYVIWPSIEAWIPRAATTVALGLCALQVAAAAHLLPLPTSSLAYVLLSSVQPAICLGVVLAHALHTPRGFRIAERALGGKFMSGITLASLLVALLLGAPTLLAQLLMVLCVGACVVREDHVLAPALRSKPIESIGKVSYGIYLMHLLAVGVAEHALGRLGIHSSFVVFLVALAAAWGVALVSFRHFEGRFLRLKARYARPESSVPTRLEPQPLT